MDVISVTNRRQSTGLTTAVDSELGADFERPFQPPHCSATPTLHSALTSPYFVINVKNLTV